MRHFRPFTVLALAGLVACAPLTRDASAVPAAGATRAWVRPLTDKDGVAAGCADAPADGAAPSYAAMLTPAGLRQIALYAYGIGPDKAQLWRGDAPTTLVADAHAAGLRVHPWTYRAENAFLPARFRQGDAPATHGDIAGEIRSALRLGIDGFFTDYPAIGVETLRAAKDHP